ncbi:MAG: pilus assembly protein N-terminal domain-containing protein [Isosphaeraceae bacterium]
MNDHIKTDERRAWGRLTRRRDLAAVLAIVGTLPLAAAAQSAALRAQSTTATSNVSSKPAVQAKAKVIAKAKTSVTMMPKEIPPSTLPILPRDPKVVKTVARQEIVRPPDGGIPQAGSAILNVGPPPANVPPAPPLPAVADDSARKDPFLDDSISEMPFRKEIHLILKRPTIVRVKSDVKTVIVGKSMVANVRWIDENEPRKPGAPRLLEIYSQYWGDTTLTLFDSDENASVYLLRVSLDTQGLQKRISRLFPGATVRIRQVGPQLILEGQVPDSKTMADVITVVQGELRVTGLANTGSLAGSLGYGNQGSSGGGMGGGAASGGGNNSTSNFNSAPPGGITNTQSAQPGLILVNRVYVPGPRQVMLKVKIAELNRTAIRQLGVNFQRITNGNLYVNSIGNVGSSIGGLVPGNSSLFGVFDAGKFSLFINALRQNNLAKILAEPNLVTLDGQPARFLAGGQFPFPVPQSSSIPGGTAVVTVQFQNFGTFLTVLPHILANDTIRLDIEPSFSQLNFASGTTVNGGPVPAIDQRSAHTIVELREGQTLAIAGLIQTTTNGQTTRIPLLGDLPIVGHLFSNDSINTTETELVVLVTPELVAPIEKNQMAATPGERVLEPTDYEFYGLGRLEGKTGHYYRSTLQYLDPIGIMRRMRGDKRWIAGPSGYAD